MNRLRRITAVASLLLASPVIAAVGDPQLKTDHPWYPGELAISTFDRLFATQAALYQRVTGRGVKTDEDKALASWLWRNTHYAHGEEGRQDCFAAGFDKAEWNRDYWTGLFAHGFGLCGTTHAQWTAEMNALLGHCRSRAVGVAGHNSFEVFLTGGVYGAGKWVLLDHDVSTVVFSPDGSRLLSIQEIGQNLKQLTDPAFKPERQRGWRVSGLHEDDAKGVFGSFNTAEYLAGYSGPPPMVQLRSGETLTRYFEPGLDDRKSFVFWGMNYNAGGTPGPERNRTWVNQPEKMYGSKNGTGAATGRARYGNAVYEYRPFASKDFADGVVDSGPSHVTFEFRTPYVIAATPSADAAKDKWGVYKPGATNGLVVRGKGRFKVSLSTDNGATFVDAGVLDGALDLTDSVKGMNQYQLRLHAGAADAAKSDLLITTVCQANPAIFPRLHDGENQISYESSGLAITGTGPGKAGAQARVVDGAMGTRSVTLELKTPRGEQAMRVYAAGWVTSGNPPDPKPASSIDYSVDGGKTWKPVVKDWRIERRTPEPKDFWSQSFVWGDADLAGASGPVRVRFTNSGKTFRKVEAYLGYEVSPKEGTKVEFVWDRTDGSRGFAIKKLAANEANAAWTISAGTGVRMHAVMIHHGD